ncbi:MAG: MBL fold metallo-hydrolase [Bacteroidales bacterium]|jgi:glyoxylase-like metal-dependent hydrolase (beta-lactamase superfamily II)
MLSIKSFVFNPFQENTYLLSDETKECIIIDPGISSDAEEKELSNYIDSNDLHPSAIYNTHCHVDHILGCDRLKQLYQIPFYAHESEKILIEGAQSFAEFFGMSIEKPPYPDKIISEQDRVRFGDSGLDIFHVPGHSPGSLVFYSGESKLAITGDVLFQGSIGRTDLPGGDYNLLIEGIRSKLLHLPKETVIYPGHGPVSTIGTEHDTNPFL